MVTAVISGLIIGATIGFFTCSIVISNKVATSENDFDEPTLMEKFKSKDTGIIELNTNGVNLYSSDEKIYKEITVLQDQVNSIKNLIEQQQNKEIIESKNENSTLLHLIDLIKCNDYENKLLICRKINELKPHIKKKKRRA